MTLSGTIRQAVIVMWLVGHYLAVLHNCLAAESVAQLTSTYSGAVNWNAADGTLTFQSSGAINFPAKATNYYDSWWEVPAEVKKIVISANVTVTGHFAFEQNGTIEGVDRNTSVIFGTNEASWANNRNLTAFEYPAIQARDNYVTINNLTLRNPKSFHIRGDGASRIKLTNANLVDTRGGGGNHSDGIVGGTGTLVDNVLFSTGDDAIKVYWGGTMYRDVTVQMIQNAVPIQLGWGDSSVNSISYFKNLSITGTSGRGGAQRYPIISGAGGAYTRRIHIEGANFQNPNASIFELEDLGQAAQGGIDKAVINSIRYKATTSTGSIAMPINGSTAQQPDFNNPTFDDPNVLAFPEDTEHTVWTGGGGTNRSIDNNSNWNLTKPTTHFPGLISGTTTAHIGSSGGAQGNALDAKLLKVSEQATLLVNNTTLGTSALTWDNGEVTLSEMGTWRSELTGALTAGFDSGGPATINIADQALLDVAGALVIGRNSRGVVNQSGGSVVVGSLSLDAGTATNNRLNLVGGTLSAASITFGDDAGSWINFVGETGASFTVRQNGFNFGALIASGRIRRDNVTVPADEFRVDTSVAGQTKLTLAGLPGDFNRDGVVDAADYVTWRDGLGTVYTASDYFLWQTNFGTSSTFSASTAVPEPSGIVFAWLAFKWLLFPHTFLLRRTPR